MEGGVLQCQGVVECVGFVFGRDCRMVVFSAMCWRLRACSTSLRDVILMCVWGGGTQLYSGLRIAFDNCDAIGFWCCLVRETEPP